MTRPAFLSRLFHRSLHGWLMGLMLLCIGEAASAQQDPPGRVARLNLQQGVVSFSPAGDDKWFDAQPNRPITTGDRLWTAANARAEIFVGSSALRLDGKTLVEFTTLDDDTLRITTMEGSLQLRVRDDLAGQRVEIDTGNLAVVIDAPGEYRVVADGTRGTSWIAVATGRATLYGENGESQTLNARQALAVSGRGLEAAGNNAQAASAGFDTWVADRSRVEDESISARYVSREVVGYQQLDGNGDWQNDGDYGAVWYPRNVDNDWAPYRDGQWVDVAPWGWTWVDAAPWGFAPFHYGRWARFGSRWGWVPGRSNARPVYSPALVAFVGGGTPNARIATVNNPNDIGWFPLAPGEQWRPGYNASRRYIDQANRMAFFRNRQVEWRDSGHANQLLPGAMTVLPADRFGRGAFGRRDLVRLPDDRFARVPVATTPSIAVPHGGFGNGSNFGRPAAMLPPAALIGRPQQQLQQARQQQQMQWQQQLQEQQQRAGQVHQFQTQPPQQQPPQFQQQQVFRQQQELQQRALQQQQIQVQQQTMLRQQQEAQQRAAQQNMAQQQQMQMQLQQQQALRQQQEMQQRAAQTHQFQVQQQQQQQQQNAMRQMQEAQVRAVQQQQQQQPSRVLAVPQPQQPQQQPQGHRFDPQRMNQGRPQ